MKKTVLFLLSSVVITISASCGGGGESLSHKELSSMTSIVSSDISSAESSSSVKPVTVADLTPDRYGEFLSYYFAKRNSYQSYQAVTEGKTASVVDQSIDVNLIRGKEYSYLRNHSKSFFLETTHLCYYHQDKALYKDNNESDFHLATLGEYLNKYGVYPFENSLEGYDCSEGMILTIEKAETEGKAQFIFAFDPEKATNNVRIQMKMFGGLDNYPTFSSVKLTVTVENDFTPISIDVDAQYKAKLVFETDCHQTYKVTYSHFNEDIEIPDLDTVKNYEGF